MCESASKMEVFSKIVTLKIWEIGDVIDRVDYVVFFKSGNWGRDTMPRRARLDAPGTLHHVHTFFYAVQSLVFPDLCAAFPRLLRLIKQGPTVSNRRSF
jgi:hypothetical protein